MIPQDMTEEFNEYFASVFKQEDVASMPDAKQFFNGSANDFVKDVLVTEEKIRNKLNKLKVDKAVRADEMSPRLLTECQEEDLSSPDKDLTKVTGRRGGARGLENSQCYTDIQKGSRTKPENYRPDSLTSQVCRIYESIIRDDIIDHLEGNKLIRELQQGFRHGKSCLSNLLCILDKITRLLEEGASVDVIYLDFAKAFDKVPYTCLSTNYEATASAGSSPTASKSD